MLSSFFRVLVMGLKATSSTGFWGAATTGLHSCGAGIQQQGASSDVQVCSDTLTVWFYSRIVQAGQGLCCLIYSTESKYHEQSVLKCNLVVDTQPKPCSAGADQPKVRT